jgi:hypothetical protein
MAPAAPELFYPHPFLDRPNPPIAPPLANANLRLVGLYGMCRAHAMMQNGLSSPERSALTQIAIVLAGLVRVAWIALENRAACFHFANRPGPRLAAGRSVPTPGGLDGILKRVRSLRRTPSLPRPCSREYALKRIRRRARRFARPPRASNCPPRRLFDRGSIRRTPNSTSFKRDRNDFLKQNSSKFHCGHLLIFTRATKPPVRCGR